MTLPPALLPICETISEAGGRAYVVGGWVRDLHLGLPSKDVDLEVFGLQREALVELLRRHGQPHTVGKSFGVIKLRTGGTELDLALPLNAQGAPDPSMSLEQAAQRRDLRCNALYYDPISRQTLDPSGGLEDLRGGVLHYVSAQSFAQDPLRALRAVRFACTKGMELAPELMQTLTLTSLEGVAAERVAWELLRILESQAPAKGLRLLHQSGLGAQLLADLDWQQAAERVAKLVPLRPQLAKPGSKLALVVTGWLLPLPRLEAHMTRLELWSWRGAPVMATALKLQRSHQRSAHPLSDYDLRRAADRQPVAMLILLRAALEGTDPAPTLLQAHSLGVASGPLPSLLGGKELKAYLPPGPRMGQVLAALRESQWQGEVSTELQARRFVQAWLEA